MAGLHEGFEFRVLIPVQALCPIIFPGSPEPFPFLNSKRETLNSKLGK